MVYPDLSGPSGRRMNYHKRIQISRPRRNLTIPGSARLPDEIFASEYWTRASALSLSLSSPLRPLALLTVDRSRRVPYFYTIDLTRFDVGPCIIQRFLFASFRSHRTYTRTLNTRDGTLALIPAGHVMRSTTCTTDTVLIISVNCAPRGGRFFHG